MRRSVVLWIVASVIATTTAANAAKIVEYLSGKIWPEPRVVSPGENGAPPSDAIVLFGGKDLSQWTGGDQWVVSDGVATAAKGGIQTKQSFGDCQFHIEWATPEVVEGKGQGRGNSGIHFMGRYELQILDSFDNPTYPDGSAGALYKQWPPLVNASRKPGEWQTYDVVFMAPRFDMDGKLLKPGYLTVLHNGVLVQNHAEILGSTSFIKAAEYEPHGPTAPLSLQFHRNPVRFRNIWIREL
ncbi:MAG TPA: DUF1080 domain-containing protein [Pirellulales bacterium]|nr:DUF1080 domain-containing protein [Pirellulales bacterium]